MSEQCTASSACVGFCGHYIELLVAFYVHQRRQLLLLIAVLALVELIGVCQFVLHFNFTIFITLSRPLPNLCPLSVNSIAVHHSTLPGVQI